jgi:hypothetical protein
LLDGFNSPRFNLASFGITDVIEVNSNERITDHAAEAIPLPGTDCFHTG